MTQTCQHCSTNFELKPNKPGYINECEDCATDVELLGGNMVWSHKTAPELEIKTLKQAKVFAKQTRRFGAGVTVCLTTSREWIANSESMKKHY